MRVPFKKQLDIKRSELEYYKIMSSIPVSFYVEFEDGIKIMEEIPITVNKFKYRIRNTKQICYPNFSQMIVKIKGKIGKIHGIVNSIDLYNEKKNHALNLSNVDVPPSTKNEAKSFR